MYLHLVPARRLHGSYEALKYGTTLDGLADMTGGITETLSVREDATGAGRTIARLLEQTSIITATVQTANQVSTGITYPWRILSRAVYLTHFISRYPNL